jgi:hypothetical protein
MKVARTVWSGGKSGDNIKRLPRYIGNKLQVEIDAGGEKTKKITFTNVMDEPSEEKVLELGEIMKALSVEGSELDGVILTSQSRYTK